MRSLIKKNARTNNNPATTDHIATIINHASLQSHMSVFPKLCANASTANGVIKQVMNEPIAPPTILQLPALTIDIWSFVKFGKTAEIAAEIPPYIAPDAIMNDTIPSQNCAV